MKPADDINRIIIGLGGQGSRVVNEVRKEVLKQGALPAGLDFIAIDSDRISLANLDSVPDEHRVHLAAPDDAITDTIVPWLPHEFRPKAGGGCGMQRLTGKGMYLVHKHRILETVREVARKLRERTQMSNFMVVLVNAAGGGTGSGMAIDFAVDLRADIKEITGQDPMMFGVGILPSRAETIQRANGAALVKELHFLLSRKEPVVVNGRDYSNPFELFFLVGREVMGIESDEDVLRGIVRFTIDLGLIPSTSGDTAAAGKGAGWVDLQDIRTLVKGASHMFSTFGCYRARFPADTLTDYFEALDKLDALRAEMPTFASKLDEKRRQLEDDKAALRHAEDVLARAKERARLLRGSGVLGANRPELAKFLAEIANMEDRVEKTRDAIAAAAEELPRLAARREEAERELHDWQTRAGTLRASLLEPRQSRANYVVTLTESEIDHLVKNRHLVLEGNFMSLMRELDRLPEYHDRTMEVVAKNKILHMPLINYRMSFQTAAAFDDEVLGTLRKHGFVRFDASGEPIVVDDQLWMVMAMLSSNPDNVDANKVSVRSFKGLVEGHVARRAEVKVVPSTSKRYEVQIHSWMVGLQVAPIAPGHPPRLRELEWLLPEYEQVARERGLAQHHAFLYGDSAAFMRLTEIPVDKTSPSRTNDTVTDFWASYQPIDAPARWMQLPPLVAETLVKAQELGRCVTSIEDGIDEFRTSDAGLPALDRLSAILSEGTSAVTEFTRIFAEEGSPLRDRLAGVAEQLERERSGPTDAEKLLAMEELTADAAGAVATASTLVASLRADLPEAIGTTIGDARAARGPTGPAAGPRDGALARWEHVLSQAEARAAHLYEASAVAMKHLATLERTIQRLQETLRTHAATAAAAGGPPASSVGFALAMEQQLSRKAGEALAGPAPREETDTSGADAPPQEEYS